MYFIHIEVVKETVIEGIDMCRYGSILGIYREGLGKLFFCKNSESIRSTE